MDNEINLDKIIEKSKQWTLEGDCSLLHWMNQISDNLEKRVTNTSSALNAMSTKLDRTSIALSNVTNNLAALQYSKFVENRVHDDDETLTNTVNVPSEVVTTDKKNSGQDIYSFLKKNVEMMNSCHEAYSISYEDSDDDDDEPVTSVVYRSKNPYEARPLPHIYGSNLWKEKWHIGLCDSDNDFSGDENSEQFSESSSTGGDSYESTAPTMSEWDSTAWGLNTQHNAVERKDMHTPSNDGESSYQGEDYPQSKVSTPRTQRSVPIVQQPSQDQRYYHHVPRRQESLFDDIFDESKKVNAQVAPAQVVPPPQVVPAPQKKIIPESYIPNEPPPDEQSSENDGNRHAGAKKTLNLFDDDEFSSFMDQIVQKATNKNINPNEQQQKDLEPSKKAVVPNLFRDFNDDVPLGDDSQKLPKRAVGPNLFDDSNVQQQKQPSKILAPSLISDSDDLFSRSSVKSQGIPTKTFAPNLFSDSDDLFTPSTSEPPIVKRKSSSPKMEYDIFTASPQSVAGIGKTKIKNLFDDDDEDDDFDNIFASKPSTKNTFNQETKNLFSDDLRLKPDNKALSVENDVPIKEGPTTSKRLFNDDSLNLENETTTKTSSLKETPKNQKIIFDEDDDKSSIVEKEITSGTPVLKKDTFNEGSLLKKGLFDDFDELEEEDDIFSNKPSKKDPFENLFKKENFDKFSANQNQVLFANEDEEEDTKKIKTKHSKLVEETDKHRSRASGNIPNLFDDALRQESPDDIFAPSSRQKKTQVDHIFADDVPDDFENFISKNPSKPVKVNEEYSKVPKSPKEPKPTPSVQLSAENQTEPNTKLVTSARLPVIAAKPSVDKISKPPPNKFMSKKNLKVDLSKKTEDEGGLNITALQQETQIISLSHPEDLHPNLESLDAPQLSGTSKSQIASSKSGSTSDLNVSEHSKDILHKKEPTINKQRFVEETQTNMVLDSDEEGLNNITKPKVVIEQNDKDISDGNSLTTQSAKKSSTIPSYTSLFHDDIPPEDENPNPTSNEESPLHTVEEDVEVKPISSSSVPYSSINLFADVPPDDYFSVSTPQSPPVAQTKRIHSIFYDDFNETIEAGREMRTPSSYMINDQPPPDDKDNKPVIPELKKEKPKVSKLKKMDFQINVGALLPSAKIPSFKKSELVEKSQSDTSIKEQNKPAISNDLVPNQVASQTRELPENILPNLNKDRAKVQVKRRPSTRTGRQEMYRKSMIEETISVADQEENDIEIKKPPFEDFETKKQEISKGLMGSNQEISREKNEIKEQAKTPISSSSFEDFGTFDQKQEINKEEPKETLNQLLDQATVYEESDNFFSKKVTSRSSSKAIPIKITSLFENSDSEYESLFEAIKSNTDKSQFDPSPHMTKSLDALFYSDIFDANPKKFLPLSTTPKETNKPPEEKSKPDVQFEPVQQKESKDQSVKTVFKSSEEPAKTTQKSSTLFGDSDENSDDLFKEANVSKKPMSNKRPEHKPKTKPINKQNKRSSSLFSSDEGSGSGDDLFGKARSKTATKKIEPAKDKASANLFADLSDEDSDDLFGTSAKKTTGVNQSKTNPPTYRVQSTTKQPAQARTTKTISNNPLSDLLGP